MKEVKSQKSNNPIKKIFIKLCRLMGYEIIDQSNFYIPTSDTNLNETLSISVNGTNMIIRSVVFDPSAPREAFTGKKEFRVLGYSKDPTVTISQIAPLNMQLNGMVVEVAFQ